MSSTLNTADQAHSDVCECAACIYLSPTPAQEGPSACVPAPASAVQGLGTITCAACGGTNTESCCHPAEFCQAICNDCNAPLNPDGSLWLEKKEPTLEDFQRWMEDKAHAAYHKVSGSSYGYPTSEDLAYALIVAECRAVTKLLMQFKLEQGA